MLVKGYMALAAGVLILYSTAGFMGWEFFSMGQRKLSKTDHTTARTRSSHYFWFSGYHGGK